LSYDRFEQLAAQRKSSVRNTRNSEASLWHGCLWPVLYDAKDAVRPLGSTRAQPVVVPSMSCCTVYCVRGESWKAAPTGRIKARKKNCSLPQILSHANQKRRRRCSRIWAATKRLWTHQVTMVAAFVYSQLDFVYGTGTHDECEAIGLGNRERL
jgi:hypothetical protein